MKRLRSENEELRRRLAGAREDYNAAVIETAKTMIAAEQLEKAARKAVEVVIPLGENDPEEWSDLKALLATIKRPDL